VPHVKQRGTHPTSVPNLPTDNKFLLQVCQRLIVDPSCMVNGADVVEGTARTGFIADLLVDGKGLFQVG